MRRLLVVILAICFIVRVGGQETLNVASSAERSKANVDEATSREAAAAEVIKANPNANARPFHGVQAVLGSSPSATENGRTARFQLGTITLIKQEYGYTKEEIEKLLRQGRIPSIIAQSLEEVVPDNGPIRRKKPNIKKRHYACPYPRDDGINKCDKKATYRTFDGTCNNKRFALYGSANTPLVRFLPPDYADGIGAPRTAASGQPFPSARKVSLAIHSGLSRPSSFLTLMAMSFGQFTDHDITRTAISKLSTDDGEQVNILCGDDGCQTDGPENAECFPIPVAPDDPMFPGPCLQFVRSAAVLDENCKPGPRQNLNQITSFVDGSHIYSSDKELADSLRDLSDSGRGRMKTRPHPFAPDNKPLLPVNEDEGCFNTTQHVKCFYAGDERVNEQPALSSLHTLFVREHNRIEDLLHTINPWWDGETLFQESRRIVGAIMQVLAYREFLPLLLGHDVMHRYKLTLKKQGYNNGYKKKINPGTANGFAGAAFRVGHSLVAGFERYSNTTYGNNEDIPLQNLFFRPARHYMTSAPGGMGMDSLMMGQISQHAEQVDAALVSSLTSFLFTEKPPHFPGHDLASLNIQRGRDQGIPGYPEWRRFCHLSVPKNFSDMEDISSSLQEKFADLYQSVEDIDLFPAGLAETNLPGANVGPTLACIIATQFYNYKYGDSFWFERRNRHTGFEKEELQQIRKASLARILCDNLDHMGHIQERVMLQPKSEFLDSIESTSELYALVQHYGEQGDNERVPCDAIPSMDLSVFKEQPPR